MDPKHQEWDFVPKGIQCDGRNVTFPELYQPTALALANDGKLMVAESLTGPRQQVLFDDVTDPDNSRLTRAFGDRGGICFGTPGEENPIKFRGIRGIAWMRREISMSPAKLARIWGEKISWPDGLTGARIPFYMEAAPGRVDRHITTSPVTAC